MESLRAEEDYWSDPARLEAGRLPVDHPEGSPCEALTETVTAVLSAAETRALLHEIPPVYRTQINDILLTALVQALNGRFGHSAFLIDLEGHGREDLFSGVDLSRTVGWFTTLFPVLLRGAARDTVGNTLKSIKEQLWAVPRKGVGYGLLRYGDSGAAIACRLKALPGGEISFNYLGQLDQILPEGGLFAAAGFGAGQEHDGQRMRPHELAFSGKVLDGQLQVALSYSRARYERATAERLILSYQQALRNVIAHCLLPEAGGRTPSDFPLARLDQTRIDQLFGNARDIEDVYPLTPLQQGILFHALYAPKSGIYVEQLSCTLQGPLDVATFTAAWQEVVTSHQVLRSSFLWEGVDAPLQVVHAQAALRVEKQDWRDLAADEQARHWAAYLAADREAGFDFARAPLMRLALMRSATDRWFFLWSHHHVLLDGWSFALILKDVFATYEAMVRGEMPQLRSSRAYRDYLLWLSGQDMVPAEAFWRRSLAGFRSPTPLPFPSSTNRISSCSGDQYPKACLTLSAQMTEAIEDFSRRQQVTLNTLVQGAWAILLSRYSGERDVVFGVTVSGRPAELAGVEAMVGLFINTLPLRVLVPLDAKVEDWLRGLFAQNLELRHYEHTPLVDIQGWSEVPRGEPLFASLLVFENYPVDRSLSGSMGNVEIGESSAQEQTNYPLTISAASGAAMELRISYDPKRFSEDAVTRMLGHFSCLLGGIAAAPEARLGDLPLLTREERHRQVVDWNATTSVFRSDACLHELFAEQVARTPDFTAISFEERRLSYAQLNARSNQLAHYLRDLGVGADQLVGLCCERSLEMVIGILAILKAGGAYLPLDPNNPEERLTFMVADAAPRLILTQERFLQSLPQNVERFCLDKEWGKIVGASIHNPANITAPLDLAYVMYTSGSTGKPKGVAVTHRGVVNRLEWMHGYLGLSEADVVLQKTPYSFDVSVWEFFSSLLTGGRLVIAQPGDHQDPMRLKGIIEHECVTIVHFVPSMLQAFLNLPDLPALSTIRHVVCSGEVLSAGLRDQFYARQTAELHNLYGPTETSIEVTAYACRRGAPEASVPIGRPIWNTEIYLLDEELNPVPLNVAGEVYIGGVGLARGYFGRPDLTAERFIPDPAGALRGGRLYRTGDLARYRADGNVEYLGRIDHQVKICGFRIELGEIEAILARQPGVHGAVVVAREDASGDKVLVAYVVGDGELEALQAGLRQHLPEYMVPSAFIRLESLPLTSNGKINRNVLPPPGAGANPVARYTAPRNAVEEILAGIWADVLGLERVGIDENFFEIGGHSLTATRVVSRIRRDLGADAAVRGLFEAPTIAELACLVRQAGSVNSTGANKRDRLQPTLGCNEERSLYSAVLRATEAVVPRSA